MSASRSSATRRRALAGSARHALSRLRQRIVPRFAPPQASRAASASVAGSVRDERGRLLDLGFHGDAYLIQLMDRILPNVHAFIETGTNQGSTARHVARRFADTPVHSCEADSQAAAQAARHVEGLANARIYAQPSPDFLYDLARAEPTLFTELNCYFLDAHGHGYIWPLADELRFISQREAGVILVDDCLVPGRPRFKHSAYAGQVCCLDYIGAALSPRHAYDLVLPDYDERTSPHHGLVGYAAIAFGTTTLRQAVDGDARFGLTRLQTPAADAA